ncbi:MAG: hypothetical protein ACJAU2_000296 [Maribacter sp.]|jgi:hypothetical protein
MKKDIEIPIAKDVHVVLIHEWNEEFLSKDWNAYVLNDTDSPIEMVMAVSKGFDDERKTSTIRHALGVIASKSFEKIEGVQEDVLALNNEFFVTYYADNKLYEKRFLFALGSVTVDALKTIPLIEKDGIMAK